MSSNKKASLITVQDTAITVIKVNKEDFILLKEALYRRHQGMPDMTEEETARIESMFR